MAFLMLSDVLGQNNALPRRGAAQAAANGGVQAQELKLHGILKSDKGLRAYIQNYVLMSYC